MKQTELLPAEIISTSDTPEYCVIWLHGLGADGNDFLPIVPELKLPEWLGVKFVFPHAPVRPVTLNNGYEMRAWYDLLSLDGNKTANESDILTTVSWITALIDDQISQGIPSQNIVLAGFSQGGVIAFHAALRYPEKLAGIMALSTYIPFMESLFQQTSEKQKGLSIFAAHGQHDPVIPFASWQKYVPALKVEGFEVESHAYAMEHSVNQQEIQDMGRWLENVLGQ